MLQLISEMCQTAGISSGNLLDNQLSKSRYQLADDEVQQLQSYRDCVTQPKCPSSFRGCNSLQASNSFVPWAEQYIFTGSDLSLASFGTSQSSLNYLLQDYNLSVIGERGCGLLYDSGHRVRRNSLCPVAHILLTNLVRRGVRLELSSSSHPIDAALLLTVVRSKPTYCWSNWSLV